MLQGRYKTRTWQIRSWPAEGAMNQFRNTDCSLKWNASCSRLQEP